MASRRIRPLTARDLDRLPDACPDDSLRTALAAGSDRPWLDEVAAQWGACGVMALNSGRVIGYLLLAPTELLPRTGVFTRGAGDDAVVVVTGRVVEEHRGHGVGRQLIQAAAALGVRRSYRALEAFGSTVPGTTLLPVSWLTAVGFEVARAHPVTPRLRMELRSTARWRTELSAVVDRLTGLVVRPVPPEPANYESSRRESEPTDLRRRVRVGW
ncbi:MAG TPA: GNAT family N-acetyltransferase [Microlunatus sp.]|nr:GNAT family N-acetyltransferase [Microlunatus sp.]